MTAQYGKNHLGDLDEHFCPPTMASTNSSAISIT